MCISILNINMYKSNDVSNSIILLSHSSRSNYSHSHTGCVIETFDNFFIFNMAKTE